MIQNLAAFAQFRRTATAAITSAVTTIANPSGASLLTVAGPDGSLITHISALPQTTATATQIRLYLSKDGGTTLTLMANAVLAAVTASSSTALSPVAFTQLDGGTLSETNPIALAGVNDYNTFTPISAGVSSGAANAQLLPRASSVTALTAGLVIDFQAGFTNSAGATLTVGSSAATTVVRDASGSALNAGDITTGFRYRVVCDGTFWRLTLTDRVYATIALTQTDAIAITAQQADF